MSPTQLNRLARVILLIGVTVAMACMVSGLLWLLLSGKPFATAGISPLEIPAAIASGDPNALIDLGIIALVATPFVRVLAVLGLAMINGDRTFVIVSGTVVGLVLLAVLIGLA